MCAIIFRFCAAISITANLSGHGHPRYPARGTLAPLRQVQAFPSKSFRFRFLWSQYVFGHQISYFGRVFETSDGQLTGLRMARGHRHDGFHIREFCLDFFSDQTQNLALFKRWPIECLNIHQS